MPLSLHIALKKGQSGLFLCRINPLFFSKTNNLYSLFYSQIRQGGQKVG